MTFVTLVVVVTLAGLVTLWCYHRRYDGLFHYVWHTRPMMVKRRCERCDACGVEWYDGKVQRWGIIPRHLRSTLRGRDHLKTNLANTRACLSCHGKGFNWERYVVMSHDIGNLDELPAKIPQDD